MFAFQRVFVDTQVYVVNHSNDVYVNNDWSFFLCNSIVNEKLIEAQILVEVTIENGCSKWKEEINSLSD